MLAMATTWAARKRAAPPATVVLALVVLAVTAGLLAIFTGPLCPDVSGQFLIARSMRHGARLYTDIVEVNPPLWFWMAIPVDWLAESLGSRPAPIIIVVTAGAVLGSVRATDRLLAYVDAARRVPLLVYAALVLLVMPAFHLEQREHIALIGAFPYLMLAGCRVQRRSVPPLLATLIGVGAALGFALKHYFLAVPALVELWLIVALARQWRPFRPETLGLAATGAIYAAAVLIFTPQYLTEVVPLGRLTYGAFEENIMRLFGPMQWLWVILLLGIGSQHRLITSARTPLTMALLMGAAGFALACLIQQKGWAYHAIPTCGCLGLAVASLIVEVRTTLGRRFILFAPALVLLPLSICTIRIELPIPARDDIAPAFADLQPNDAIGMISIMGLTSWPSMVDRNLRLSNRYMTFWILHALDRQPENSAVIRAAEAAVHQTVVDFRCTPPKVIVFVRFDKGRNYKNIIANPSRFFMQHEEFVSLMHHYRIDRQGHLFDSYVPTSPLPPIDRRLCRRWT